MKRMTQKIKPSIFLILIIIFATFLRIQRMLEWPVVSFEALHMNFAMEILQGTRHIYEPVMYHQGPMILYFLLPLTFLFKDNVFLLRLSLVSINILSILLLYLFTKKFYNKKIALLTAFVLAVTPNDILNSSLVFETTLVTFFILLSINLLYKFISNKKIYYLYLFAVVLGFGLSTRLSFLFFVIALFIALKLYPPNKLAQIKKQIKINQLIPLLLFFLLGAFPILYWNLLNNFATLTFVLSSIPTTNYGVSLLDFKGNVLTSYHDFIKFLDHEERIIPTTFESIPHTYGALFLISLLIFIFLPILRLRRSKFAEVLSKNLLIFLIFILFLTLKSTLTVSVFASEDFLPLLPIYSIIIAWSVYTTFIFLKNTKVFLLLLLIFLFSLNFVVFFSNLDQNLSQVKDNPCYSIIPKLLTYSENSSSNILVFSTNRYREIFKFYQPNAKTFYLEGRFGTMDRTNIPWNEIIKQKNATYVFVIESCDPYWARNIELDFIEFLAKNNKKLLLEKNITLDNVPLLTLFKVA